MAESSNPEAGKRFASDLREIREHRGITADALHDETKIPMGLIQSFEQTGLFDHPMFNRVYLRSFVRTYSQVVGIAQDLALASLDEALDGTYRGGLRDAYLGVTEQAEEQPEETAPPEEMPGPAEVAPSAARVYPESEPLEPVYQEPESADLSAPPEESIPAAEEELPPAPVFQSEGAPADAEATASRDMAPNRPATRRVAAQRRPVEERASKGWMYVLVGVVAFAVLGFLLFSTLGTPGDDPAIATDGNEAEAVAATDTSTEGRETTPPVVLGDTMNVTIFAANAPVQNIKVTVDDDLRRPYWIELGASRTFLPTQRIVIERQLPKIELRVEGRPYPTNRLDELGRIVITRDSVLQILNSSL